MDHATSINEGSPRMDECSVCAVLITFRPEPTVLDNVDLLRRQLAHIIIVDNTPAGVPSSSVEILAKMPGCTVIRNEKNLGIATALNIGIRAAISKGFPWIIAFDQDSQVCEGYVEAMLSTYEEAAQEIKVGMLSPRYLDARLGTFLPALRSVTGEILTCMTSGSMIAAETFSLAGPMEDGLFIDYVDIEYCLRMRNMGLKIIESPSSILAHSLGYITRHSLLGWNFSTTNHSAGRRYYITRNRLTLIKRYLFTQREWALWDLSDSIKALIKIILVEDEKAMKIRYVAKAAIDAALGRLGPRISL